jgi:hypothetical protein
MENPDNAHQAITTAQITIAKANPGRTAIAKTIAGRLIKASRSQECNSREGRNKIIPHSSGATLNFGKKSQIRSLVSAKGS